MCRIHFERHNFPTYICVCILTLYTRTFPSYTYITPHFSHPPLYIVVFGAISRPPRRTSLSSQQTNKRPRVVWFFFFAPPHTLNYICYQMVLIFSFPLHSLIFLIWYKSFKKHEEYATVVVGTPACIIPSRVYKRNLLMVSDTATRTVGEKISTSARLISQDFYKRGCGVFSLSARTFNRKKTNIEQYLVENRKEHVVVSLDKGDFC